MKSKVKDRKNDMGFRKKWPSCGNCVYFSSVFKENEYGCISEKLKRCVKGNFAVTKTNWCNLHEYTQGDPV